MLDLGKVERLSGWVSERDACERWFSSMYDSITIDHVYDPEHEKYLRCNDIPDPGMSISMYGEFSDEDRFSYIVESVDLEKEVVTAVTEEDDEDERIDIPFLELCCLDDKPQWSTLWALYHKPSYEEIMKYNDCGISVYETESSDFYIGINGCGYDFFEAHWLPLYRVEGVGWHTTEAEWIAELKARLKCFIEASTEVPSDMSWSERSDLLSQLSGDLLNSKRIARKARLALIRYRLRCFFNKLKAVLTIDPKPYRTKPKKLA